jgi:hypothetical protein
MKSIATVLGDVALQIAAMVVVVLLGATPAFAADVPCGTATAYTAPTATTQGSVTIGASTFVLAAGATTVGAPAGSTPQQPPIGFGTCINGPRDASGAFTAFSFSPMSAGICGAVSGYVPASATATGSITVTNGATAPSTLPVATGVTLSPAQVTGNQCFTLGVDAQGTGQVTGYAGPQGGGPSTTSAPSTAAPSTAAPSADPSTTAQPQTGTLSLGLLWLLVALAVIALVGVLFARSRRTRTP